MNLSIIRNGGIVILVVLVLGVLFWIGQDTAETLEDTEHRVDTTTETEDLGYTDPADLEIGQQFGVFTVESNERDENGNLVIQLRGETVVKGRYFARNSFNQDPTGGDVCFFLIEPFAPS